MYQKYWILAILIFSGLNVFAQEPDDEEEFDFSSLVAAEEVKAFCSSRILSGGPQNLVSVGYEVQGSFDLDAGSYLDYEMQDIFVGTVNQFRFDVQYPIISKNNITVALQFNLLSTAFRYGEDEGLTNPLLRTLDENGLTSTSFSTVIFKPLDIDNFMIFQVGAALNGDYSLSDFQSLDYTRISAAVIYGWKPNDRKMYGFGLSRTYLGGALNYIPVFYYQSSSPDGRWSADVLLLQRAYVKRNFSKKSILSLGFNVQGSSYHLDDLVEVNNGQLIEPELRRSELRISATYNRAITNTIWFSLESGLRYNWEFNVDDGDFYRSFFNDEPFLIENTLGNPLYGQISLSWVSP